MRGRIEEEIYKLLQALDPIASPHIEEILILISSLSLFFDKNMQESLEGLRFSKLVQVNSGGRKFVADLGKHWERRPPLKIGSPKSNHYSLEL
jgi:hypothetical protein